MALLCRILIWELFDTHVDGVLKWIRKHGNELIPSVDNNLTTSVARIMQSLLHPRRGLTYKVRPAACSCTVSTFHWLLCCETMHW